MLLTNLQAATMTGGYGIIPKAAVLVENDSSPGSVRRRMRPQDPPSTAAAGSHPGLIDCHTHLVYGGNRPMNSNSG